MRNYLYKKNKIFKCPSLTLSDGNLIEAGVCSMNQIRELRNMRKNNLIYRVRLSQEGTCLINLGKKSKACPNLFGPELTSGLRDEFDERAKGTYQFLELTHDCVIQPLLTSSSCKHKYDLKAMPFKDANDFRLKCMTEIAN